MILSASMMLDWLAERHSDEAAGAAGIMVEQAVARMLAEGKTKTTDLGGTALTSDVAEAVIKNLA